MAHTSCSSVLFYLHSCTALYVKLYDISHCIYTSHTYICTQPQQIVSASTPLLSALDRPLLPNGSLYMATCIPPKHALALFWTKASAYRDPMLGFVDHSSYRELQASAADAESGTTLSTCLKAFTQ
eukprot:14151-Heterococcus_DN1.PRE.1